MRIRSATLKLSLILFVNGVLPAQADSICGTFKATVFIPEDGQGTSVIANPKAVTPSRLRLPKSETLSDMTWGQLNEIEFRSKTVCYRDCEIENVKIIRRVSPFETFGPFERKPTDLVHSEPCQPSPMEVIRQ